MSESPPGPGLFPEQIRTERLLLEPRTPEYADATRVYEICGDDGIERVTRWLPWSRHEAPTTSAAFLERGRQGWEDGTGAAYVLRLREGEPGGEPGEIAGFGGLHVDWDRQAGFLGVWLREPFWGRGYSGERAAVLVELAFDRLDLEVVKVSHEPRNEQSQRAISRYVDRLGGRREGVKRNVTPYDDGTVHDEVWYSISRDEWLSATDGGTSVL